jgi:hypothetical protein
MSIRYVDAAERTGLQTLPCDPDRIARGFRSNERLFILAWSSKFRPVFSGLGWTQRSLCFNLLTATLA